MDEKLKKVYLVNFDSFRYAVGEDEVINHFIPVELMLLPSGPEDRRIFVTTLGDDLFYLYDIARFLGGKSGDFESAKQVFVISETDKVHGFFINHICDEPRVPELCLSLPEYIRSPLLDSAVIIDGKPFPLLNIRELQDRMQEQDLPDPGISLKIAGPGKKDVAGAKSYSRYGCGPRWFCIPDYMLPESEIVKAPVAPVSFYPDRVAGLTRYREGIIPVIQLFENGEDKGGDRLFVVSAAGDTNVGLLADTRAGEIDPAHMPLRELPPVARCGGWSHAFVDDGNFYPLVDLYGVLDEVGDIQEREKFKELYVPSSGFLSVFLNDVIEIMEFEFGGNCYGLPREEVMECFSFMGYSDFPGLPAMIPGLLFYKDELLPVLDLALWSGESSYRATYRDMVFLVNGNLRLVIAVEKVLDWKRVEREGQREYRHLFVYGCYWDEKLKLILNIEAMLKNYEKIEFSLIEHREEEKGEILPVEKETVPEEIPVPEAPVETAAEDADEMKDIPEKTDTSAEEEKEEPAVKEERFSGEDETGKQDAVPGKEPAVLKEDDLREPEYQSPEKREPATEKREDVVQKTTAPEYITSTADMRKPVAGKREEPDRKAAPAPEEKMSAAEKREAVTGKREDPDRKIFPVPEKEFSTIETMKGKPVTARGMKILPVLIPVLLFVLIAGLVYTFFFAGGTGKIIPVKEEITESGKESFPGDKAVKEEPAGEREAVKEPEKTGAGIQDKTLPERSRFILREDEKRIVFSHVLFPADSDELLPAEVQKLDGIASLLALHRGSEVRVAGYTARFGSGTETGRKLLSGKRAGAVVKYLVSAGACKKENVNYRSMGASSPVADNSSPEGRKKNRRVEIILFKE